MKGSSLIKVFFIVLLLSSATTNAQYKEGGYVTAFHAHFNSPQGNFRNIAELSLGLDIIGQYFISNEFSVQGTFSYENWNAKGGTFARLKAFSFQGGGRLYANPGWLRLYAGAEAGLHLFSQEYYPGYYYAGGGSDIELYFGGAPFAGFLLKISDDLYIDANVAYNFILSEDDNPDSFDYNWIGIRIGVSYMD